MFFFLHTFIKLYPSFHTHHLNSNNFHLLKRILVMEGLNGFFHVLCLCNYSGDIIWFASQHQHHQ